MGCGFLLFGYFFFCDLTIGVPDTAIRFDVLPDVFGWILLCVGCCIGAHYSDKLRIGKYISLVMILPAAFSLFNSLGLWDFLYADVFYRRIYPFFSVLLTVLFHYYLLFGLRDIADACGDQKALSLRLARNFYMTLFCFFWIFLARLVLQFAPQFVGYCSLVSAFCTMVYLILNALAIFKVYREITVE